MDRRCFIQKLAVTLVGIVFLNNRTVANAVENSTAPRGNVTKRKSNKSMNIVVLTGSPRTNEQSAYLADQFIHVEAEAGTGML